MQIYCCNCKQDVDARLTNGSEIYPHRHDLSGLPFWKCDECGEFVGCHHKTKDRTRPLGVIPSLAIKSKRKTIHKILDPIWKGGRMRRGEVYSILSKKLGREYHTAELRDLEEADLVINEIKSIRQSLGLITI